MTLLPLQCRVVNSKISFNSDFKWSTTIDLSWTFWSLFNKTVNNWEFMASSFLKTSNFALYEAYWINSTTGWRKFPICKMGWYISCSFTLMLSRQKKKTWDYNTPPPHPQPNIEFLFLKFMKNQLSNCYVLILKCLL
jgi:hypothetical protein